ncbi:T9SS type A sorting domain-containing protein [Rhodocaloribacter litoris]|nr:T9SS type A sorting domain-containing protein [Rhodocaloribacter litoris]
MIENHRTGRVWDVFMQHEAVQRGLERAGFTPVSTGQAPSPEAPGGTRLLPAYPSPATTRAVIPFTLAVPAHVRLRVHDLLGRTVATLVDGARPAGRHEAALDVAGLPAGVYVYTLTAGTARATGKLVVY